MPKQAMSQAALNEWVKKTPLKKIGLPVQIAEGIIFILIKDFVCGRTLEIDGGLRM